MIVKGGRKDLFARLDKLDWDSVPVAFRAEGKGRGRREVRAIKVMGGPPGLGFPHAAQVFLLERHTTGEERKRAKGKGSRGKHETVEVKTAVAVFGGGVRGGRPVRAGGRPGASGRLRPGALADREQDPLRGWCHVR
jgi:hypothetical protein